VLRVAEEADLSSGSEQAVERQPPKRGDGEGVEPAGELGQHGLPEPVGRHPAPRHHQDAAGIGLSGEACVAMDERGGLARPRRAAHRRERPIVVDHRLLLRRELHALDATDEV
jgi:hypothetical protein